MKTLNTLVLTLLHVFVLSASSRAQETKEVHKSFKDVKSIDIETISGDCIIKTGTRGEVLLDLVYKVVPENAFNPVIREDGDQLVLKEKWSGRNSSGDVLWTLTVLPETEIEFSSASGNVTATGLSKSIKASSASGKMTIDRNEGLLELSSASGNIRIENAGGKMEVSSASGDITAMGVKGEINLKAASGTVRVKDAKGTLDLRSASGDVEAERLSIDRSSSFFSASGDVFVILSESPKYDMELGSASGDAVLELNGHAVNGYFEMVAMKKHGEIVCPFAFDKEEEYTENREIYLKKSFVKGSNEPKISVHTGSGKAILKK